MRRIFKYFTLLLFGGVSAFAAHNDVSIVSSTSQQMILEVTIPDWIERDINAASGSYKAFTFKDAELLGEIGTPQLPVKTLTLGVPQNGDMSVQVLDFDSETLPNTRLAPIPYIKRTDMDVQYTFEPDERVYQQNENFPAAVVSAGEPYPFRSQRLVKLQVFPLHYQPLQNTVRKYNRIRLQVTFTGNVNNSPQIQPQENEFVYEKLLLNYEQARAWRAVPPQSLLRKAATNSFQGENWFKVTITGDGTGGMEGMYKITGATLREVLQKENKTLSSIDPATIQVFNNGGRELSHDVVNAKNDTLVENAILVVGGNDGSFDESDYILFYGRSLEGEEFVENRNQFRHYIHPYSYKNVCWITFNAQRGKRMESLSSLPTDGLSPQPHFRDLAWIEEERYNIYNSGTVWLGRELTNRSNTYSVSFDLPGAVPQEQAEFRFSLASLTSGRHYFSMYANGNNLGQYEQSGATYSYALNQTSFVADGVLMSGENTVTVNYNMSSDAAFSYVDYIELEYRRAFQALDDRLIFTAPLQNEPARYQISGFSRSDIRVFDVTDFANVREIRAEVNNGVVDFADQSNMLDTKRYIAAAPSVFKNVGAETITPEDIAGLRNMAVNADYIIITHDDFYQQAQQLESLRENWSPKDRLETHVVNYSDVIKEFGWGIEDPAAIRNFLAWAQDNWGSPQYVLLVGDGHFDYKNIRKQNVPNLIIPYETEGTYENYTRVTDDWFTYTEGNDAGMQMAIGRLIVQTVDEAQNVINKIIQYETQPEYGEWLKTVTIVADDEYTNDTDWEILHTDQAERLAEQYVPDLLNVNKIYLIDYPAVKTASITGREKPAATLDLLEQINRGSLIINYIGHGNDELWAHEKVLDHTRDFSKFENGKRLAMWVAATCEFAHWDQPVDQSFAERILGAQNRGAVSMVSSARLAYADDNAAFNYLLYQYLFDGYEETGRTARVGDAVMLGKEIKTNRRNNEKYALFGDPAMRLCAPQYRAVINDITPDSIQALSKMQISGYIENQDQMLADYNGKMLVRVLDTRKGYKYESPSGVNSRTLYTEGNTIFRGQAKIENGEFNVQFIVPKDISYGGGDGRISLYFWDDNSSGTGYRHGLGVGGTAVDLVDNQGPTMQAYFGDPSFVPGDYVSTRPTLTVEVADSLSGVNTAGDVGHQILLTIDEDFTNSIDVTEYFTYNEGSYTNGKLSYTILDMPIGEHIIQVKAWDNSNNSSIVETHFVVIDDSELNVRNALNYPNPMTDESTFRYELSQDAQVSIKIFTVAGRLIKTFDPMPGRVGYNIFPQSWDGRDEQGDPVANGVYLYKISAKSYTETETLTAEAVEKLIVAR